MKNNAELQKDVQDAIKWEPLLNAAEIGVTVKDGVVTLTGTVTSFPKKAEAEHAAKNVAGVKAVVENIEIAFGNWGKTTDGEIANEVLSALKLNWLVPHEKIKVKVEDGWVTLEGELHWNYQREAAKDTLHNLIGIKGISNDIKIKPEVEDAIEQKAVEAALERNWSINTNDIKVKVSGTTVTLTGHVNSWYQREEAERIAWKTPGIWSVDNELLVEYDYELMD